MATERTYKHETTNEKVFEIEQAMETLRRLALPGDKRYHLNKNFKPVHEQAEFVRKTRKELEDQFSLMEDGQVITEPVNYMMPNGEAVPGTRPKMDDREEFEAEVKKVMEQPFTLEGVMFNYKDFESFKYASEVDSALDFMFYYDDMEKKATKSKKARGKAAA